MNRPSRRLVALAPALLLAAPALAQARKRGPAKKLFPYLDAYLQLPAAQRSRFRLSYYLSRDGRPATGLDAWLVQGSTRTPLSVGAEGRISPLPTLAQWRSGEIELDAPADAPFNISMEVEPLLAPAASMPVAPLAEAVAQADAAVRRAAGVLRFAAPRLDRIGLMGVESARVRLASGAEKALPVARGQALFVPADHAGASLISCTPAPRRLRVIGR